MLYAKYKKNTSAFTIIELLAVIVITSILMTIGIVSYNRVQSNVRDTQRSTRISLISESLESYYLNNGEYPSCSAMSQTPSVVVDSVLIGINQDVLASPTAPSGTNSIVSCSGDPTDDVYHYLGGASSYILKYKEEVSGNVVSVVSRHSVPTPVPDIPTFPITVLPPVASVVHIYQPTRVHCNAGDPEYHFRYRIDNSSTWIEPGAWDVSQSAVAYNLTTQQGKKYGLQMRARCNSLGSVGAILDSPEAVVIAPITTTPSGPIIAVNTVINTTTWTWNDVAATCPVGTTPSYQYRYTISPAGSDSGWVDNGTNLSISFTTSLAGQTYTVAMQARCSSTFATGDWNASISADYVKPAGGGALAYSKLGAGGSFTCAIATDDNAYCWGSNSNGQVGDTTATDRSVPTPVVRTGVLAGLTLKSISAGLYHVCAIASDDNAYCWGANDNGELGIGTSGPGNSSPVPVAVTRTGALAGLTIKSIVGGGSHTCAIASDNNAYCWGLNSDGRLGSGGTANNTTPVAVTRTGALSGLTIKSITAGAFHTCAIASDNNAYCWGGNSQGTLGDSTTTGRLVPTAVTRTGVLSGLTIKAIDGGYYHNCVVASDDNTYCWGYNSTEGRLGNNSTAISSSPVAVVRTGVLSGLTVKSLDVGIYHNCVIASDDNTYCWGLNMYGGLGDGTTTSRLTPIAVSKTGVLASLTTKFIINGGYHTCIIASDDNVYCWGYNNKGQIGNGNVGVNLLLPPTKTSTPAVSTSSVANTTTWSWPATTVCIAPGSVTYQYRYTIAPSGFDSGWVDNSTNLSVAFTTSTIGQTYTVAVQSKCSGSSVWSASGSASRIMPTAMTAILPTGYVTATGTAPTTTTVTNINRTIAAFDATYFVAGANSIGTAFYDITNMPSNFNAFSSLTYNIRYRMTPLAGDTATLSLRLYKADRITPLTDSMVVRSSAATVAEVTKGVTIFTGISTTATKADWDSAVLGVVTANARVGGADGSIISINEVELGGIYQ